MLVLVTGGSASGKSEYAETQACLCRTDNGDVVYIATMIPADEECEKRIVRHRKMRSQKGFTTVECYTNLSAVSVPKGSVVLLECMSNLVANELYCLNGAHEKTAECILAGVRHLCEQAEYVIVVSNEIVSDGRTYEESTMNYLNTLAAVNCALARHAQQVTEVVCSIPIIHKP
nr:bifunctional adenosylcobinamide kinase/adenosylcobinamide-phosphate guanylyltransferase [uncultured Caproiciproducens sp.]